MHLVKQPQSSAAIARGRLEGATWPCPTDRRAAQRIPCLHHPPRPCHSPQRALVSQHARPFHRGCTQFAVRKSGTADDSLVVRRPRLHPSTLAVTLVTLPQSASQSVIRSDPASVGQSSTVTLPQSVGRSSTVTLPRSVSRSVVPPAHGITALPHRTRRLACMWTAALRARRARRRPASRTTAAATTRRQTRTISPRTGTRRAANAAATGLRYTETATTDRQTDTHTHTHTHMHHCST